MTEQTTEYSNTREVSNDIVRISDLAYQLKVLEANFETADPKVIEKIASDFAESKMDIIDWMKESINYDLFKNSPDAKQALFLKQVKEGFYDHEIGLNQELKDKIYRDFLQKFNLTPPEELMTAQEKRNLQMLQQNNTEENSNTGALVLAGIAEAKFLFNVYSKTRCFENNWDYVQNNLPGKDLLDKDTLNLLKTIKENPHFLKDNPNHFLKNKGDYKDLAPELQDVFEAVHSSSLGDPEGKEKIKKFEKMFKDFIEKKPEAQAIQKEREKAMKKDAKKDFKFGLDKPTPF